MHVGSPHSLQLVLGRFLRISTTLSFMLATSFLRGLEDPAAHPTAGFLHWRFHAMERAIEREQK
jgi:hypothetical protein